MAFRIRLVGNSPEPIFTQIVRQVREGLAQGRLKPGDQLPTVRDLAAEILVNPNTVAKAYQDLERSGILSTRRGSGSFISDGIPAVASSERERLIKEKIHACLTEAVHLGLSRKSVMRLIAEAAEKFRWVEE